MARRMAWFGAAFLICCGGLVVLPQIDLWVSGLFYRPDAGFFLGEWLPFHIIRIGLPYLVTAFAVTIGALLIASLIRHRAVFGLDSRAALFLLLSLALGPGLTVNTIFKDHWGRARPTQIIEFGGDKKFTRAFVPSDQCTRNCSFPAGDPSIGFYLVSLAFLAETPRRQRGVIGALAVGAGLGVVRIAQGGHFFSDVVASGFLIYGMSWLTYQAVIVQDGVAALAAAWRRPSPELQRGLWLGAAALSLAMLSYFFIDQPLAWFCRDLDPRIRGTFRVITQFGGGGVYLVPLGIVIIGALVMGRKTLVQGAGYVFAAVAIPGLIADILKPVFGRARPQLLFEQQVFGFTWSGPHADHWSFPSGHSITILALATALYAIYPRLWPVYALAAILVTASRVIIDAHYLSDVIAGAYFGFITAWILALALKQQGVVLALRNGKLSDSP
jgi:lipid A 4'-phosphatase